MSNEKKLPDKEDLFEIPFPPQYLGLLNGKEIKLWMDGWASCYREQRKALAEEKKRHEKVVDALKKFTILNTEHYKDIAGLIDNAKDVLNNY